MVTVGGRDRGPAASTGRIGARSTLGFAVLHALAVLAGRSVHIADVPVALAWPAAGVVTVWLLSIVDRRDRLVAAALIFLSTGAINSWTGLEAVTGWSMGVVNVLSGAVAVAVLRAGGWTGRRIVRTFDDVARLALASVAAGVVTALLGGLVLTVRGEASFGDAVVLFGMRNLVSTFVISAAILALDDWHGLRPSTRSVLAQITACVVVAAGAMMAPLPMAFVMAAPVILVAITCGPQPTSVAVALQGVVVVTATAAGFGQFAGIPDPQTRLLMAQFLLVMLAGGALVVAVTAQDRADALEASRRDRDRLHDYMEAALVSAAHLALDARGRIVVTDTNASLSVLTGHRREVLIGTEPTGWLAPDDARRLVEGAVSLAAGTVAGWRSPLRLAASHGGGWVDAALALVDHESAPDGVRTLLKLQMIDITAQRQAERDLARAALHDDLTGLANRVLWSERLRVALAAAARGGGSTRVAVLYVDVDHFKQINDAYGHDVGDEVLRAVARRLEAAMRPRDTVARMGGDEFVLLCTDAGTEPRAGSARDADPGVRPLADRVHDALRSPVVVGPRAIVVTVSVGVGVAEAGELDGRAVLRRADAALYSAKASGRARTEIYRTEAHAAQERMAEVLLDLEQGQRAGELTVHYQPIVDAASGETVALEALLRWSHPLRGCLEPKEFLDVLETSDLIHPVGGQVLARACVDGARLARAGRPLDMHVNVSAAELARPGLAERVRAVLDASGLPPGLLVLEVTETRLVAVTPTLVRELDEVRGLGVRIAVDDFGTGYSTLTHLVDLPIGVVKLDRSFVADVTHTAGARSVSAGVRAMAEGLGVVAIAEGVETAEQARVLRDLGYLRLQGYHCGRPGPLEEVVEVSMART